jgi:hypothetical protein
MESGRSLIPPGNRAASVLFANRTVALLSIQFTQGWGSFPSYHNPKVRVRCVQVFVRRRGRPECQHLLPKFLQERPLIIHGLTNELGLNAQLHSIRCSLRGEKV